MTQGGESRERLPRRLARRMALARAAIFLERVWLALWPLLGTLGLFLALALLDGFRLLPGWLHLAILAGFAGLLAVLGWRAARRLRWPDRRAAERRLESASGLAHRPLTALMDRPAAADALGQALWLAHLRRAMTQLGRLRVGRPRPGLAARDRRALRGGLVVALAAALVIAGPDAPGRLAGAFRPDLGTAAVVPDIQIQGWFTPPAYTRLAPSFLKSEGGAVAAPAGSRLTVNVTGGTEQPSLRFGGDEAPMRPLDASSFQTERPLTADGRLSLRIAGQERAGWEVTVIPDHPPRATWPEPPGGMPEARQLRRPSLNARLPWQVADDYGVVGLRVEIHLRARPAAPPLVLDLPLGAGERTAAQGVAQPNLVAHPWAGLDVRARLIARDALEQTGASEPAHFILPERPFEHPVAQLLIGVRKQLSLAPEDRASAIRQLRGLLAAPEALAGDYSAWVNLSAIASLLVRDNKRADVVAEAQQRLWELALHLEEGGAERTARALEAARKEARDALEQSRRNPEDAAKRAELERKLQELRDAIRQHLEALRERAERETAMIPPEIDHLTQRDMERLAREAEQAAREGKPEEARERLAELERILEEMRNALANPAAGEQRRAERRQRGRQQMSVVQDLIGREGKILDHAQGRIPQQPARPPQAQPVPNATPQDAPPQQPERSRQTDARVQQAMRRALGEMMQQFGDLTGKIPPSLNEADLAMREATEALGAGQDGRAAQAAQRAIEALQRGGREMGQQMARQFGPPQPGEAGQDPDGQMPGFGFSLRDGPGDPLSGGFRGQHGRRREDTRRDPLGRQYGEGTGGAEDGMDVQVPPEMESLRSQGIQRELRRRGGERFRPQQELDYIERLLSPF